MRPSVRLAFVAYRLIKRGVARSVVALLCVVVLNELRPVPIGFLIASSDINTSADRPR